MFIYVWWYNDIWYDIEFVFGVSNLLISKKVFPSHPALLRSPLMMAGWLTIQDMGEFVTWHHWTKPPRKRIGYPEWCGTLKYGFCKPPVLYSLIYYYLRLSSLGKIRGTTTLDIHPNFLCFHFCWSHFFWATNLRTHSFDSLNAQRGIVRGRHPHCSRDFQNSLAFRQKVISKERIISSSSRVFLFFFNKK